MDPGRWERVKEVYHSALDRDPSERAAFLDQACRDDREIRREVESLLAGASAGSFLERPAWQTGDSGEEAPAIGEPSDAAGRRHPFLGVVWLVTVLLAVAFGYSAWKMTADVADFGWSEVPRGRYWQVAAVGASGPAAGKLLPGDILVSLDGNPNVARLGTGFYRNVLGIGAAYRVQVSRGGVTHEYTLATGRRRRDLTSAAQGFLLGLAWCVIGVFIGFARPQDAVARLAFAAATLTGFAFLQANNLPALWALQPLHGVLGYHFFYRFPSDPPRGRGWRTLLHALYLGAAGFNCWYAIPKGLVLMRGGSVAELAVCGPPSPLRLETFQALFGITMIAAVAVAIHKYRALSDPGQRRRFHWIAFGGFWGLAPEVPLVVGSIVRADPRVAAWLFPGREWLWCVWAVSWCSVAIPLTVAYAVVRHQVFDVRIAIRRGVQYLFARRALQALLALPSGALLYTLVSQRNRTIAETVTHSSGYLVWIVALVLSLKVRGPLLRWLDRRFFRAQYDSEQVVLSLVDELAGLDSAEEVSGFLCRQLERSLHPKSMQLWWRENGVMRLAGDSDPSRGNPPCPVGDALLNRIQQLGTAVPVPLPASTGASLGESRRMARLGIRLIVPVTAGGEVEGVLMLGEKQSEEPYSDGDTRLVHAIARQTAVVLDNLRLKGCVRDEQRIRRDVLAKLDRGLVSLMRECPVCGACYDSGAETCERDGNALTLTLPVARTVDGKYRLDRLIGRGGMGAVYEARDLRLGREVAVKVMLAGAFGHEGSLRRFRREAQAVARLNHPNVVALHDFGELEGGGAYLVMERVAGVTLRAEIKRVGIFTPAAAADWFEPMLDGLAAAHEQGVVHRDFKPENVLGARLASGALAVKILDFGLAKIRPMAAAATASQSLTESGVVLGTLAYMAPEQLLGQDVDPRADIYSAGVILAEMLTGSRPFGDGAGLRRDYHLPAGLPNQPALDLVVQRCLAVAPPERFPSAAELRAALIPALRACGGAGAARSGC